MDKVSVNLFADIIVEIPAAEPKPKAKAKAKAKSKRPKGNINKVCGDMFSDYYNGVNLFAA